MSAAPGSLQAQIALLEALDRYEFAERLAQLLPTIPEVGKAADHWHQVMFEAALNCGFDPAFSHAHLTSLTWARRRAVLIRATFPNNSDERRAA